MSSTAFSLTLNRVGVSFPVYDTTSRSLRHHIVRTGTGGLIGSDARKRPQVDALNNICIKLEEGDRLALIGHNGAGKTTLLRVMAGIYEPTLGDIRACGRIAPLFDIGLGIDPDSTGYENIKLRGLYLGLTRSEIEARKDEIAEFTELGSFLDMPVRTYSMGMLTRLTFAVSTSIDPEILLLDEGIGAGDTAFIQKANARLHSFIERAGILVLASHSEHLVRLFCNKAALLEHGSLKHLGSVNEVFETYGV